MYICIGKMINYNQRTRNPLDDIVKFPNMRYRRCGVRTQEV